MKAVGFPRPGESVSLLCLGAHSDDIEIGAGGTVLRWIESGVVLHVHWCVLSASGARGIEARQSATSFLEGAASAELELQEFRDGFFPYHGAEIKTWMEELKTRVQPDVIFTHWDKDAHQDHREISRLTWNTFRNHLILEYEVPKWDGDLGQPNVFSILPAAILERKLSLLLAGFETQRSKDWFDAEIFRSLARLRGMECRAPECFAEGFFVRKALLG